MANETHERSPAGDAEAAAPGAETIPAAEASEPVNPAPAEDAAAAPVPGDPTPARTPPAEPLAAAEPAAASAAAPAAAEATAGANNAPSQDELDVFLGTAGITAAPRPAAPLAASAGAAPAAVAGGDEVEREMAAAFAAEAVATPGSPAVLNAAVTVTPEAAVAYSAPSLPAGTKSGTTGIDLLDDVQLDVKIELGRTEMYIDDVLKLGVGSVVELDKLAGDPVDIFVNERLVARGEVIVLNDNFCVRINNILSPVPELETA